MEKRKIKQRGKPKAKQAAKVVAKKISKAPVRKAKVPEKAKEIVSEAKVVKSGPKKVAKVSKAAKKTQLKKKAAAKKKQVKKEEAKTKVVVVEKKKFERPKKVAKKPIIEQDDEDSSQDEQPAAAKKEAKPSTKWSYTPEQKQIYQDTLKKYSDENLIIIKKLLQKNGQSMSGNKSEVLEKLGDGFALGAIPRCPHCFGGRPKFNKSNGTYKCPGFRDDVDYKFCNKTFTFTEITREKWIE